MLWSLESIAWLFILGIGLPHGALDPLFAEQMRWLDNLQRRFLFFAGYLLLALVVALIWYLLPLFMLTAFLLYSAWHFGGDYVNGFLRFTYGGLILLAPLVWAPVESSEILQAVSLGQDTTFLISVAPAIAIACVAILLLVYRNRNLRHWAELAVLWCCAAVLDPLFYFAVYFCCAHSLRHYRQAFTELQNHSTYRLLLTLVGFSTIAWLAGGAGYYWWLEQRGVAFSALVFIGLAALTVPHMVVMETYHYWRQKQWPPTTTVPTRDQQAQQS